MDKTQALQNLLNGTASEEEINLLKGGLASGEISIGGNVNQSVIIIGSGNTVELPPAALDRLGGRSLLGDLDRDLTGDEIAVGLNRLEAKLPVRAPVLLTQFQELARRLRPTLKTNPKSLSDHARRERVEALAQINSLCMEALDISFNALCLGEEPPEYDSRSPFRGLESFRPEDSEFFFGREVLTKKLVAKIQSYPFLAVLGASGSGKSSLVMAGLIPALGSEYIIFRPGTNPLEALETVKENILVVVDQFEELFTLTRDESTHKEFIGKLLETTKQNKVVITLRSDFLGEVGAYRNLNEEVQSHLENVPPMDMDELRRAMEGQANQVGLRFEADLSQQILDDVEGEPGAMPLLQHALWELWNRRHGRNLRASEYRAFGGVKQAITSTAEKVYAECTKAEQEQIRDIFLRLTRLDDSNEGRDTRKRVALSDLIPSGQDTVLTTLLLDKLANARLIVKTVNKDKTEIEVAHEALIRHWERLRGWLNEDRDNLRLRENLSEDARRWESAGKDEALLNHRGGRLEDALELYNLLNVMEQSYLTACMDIQRDKKRYTALFAHQLKGPLNAIWGDVEYQLDYINNNYESDKRLKQISNRLEEHLGRIKKELDNFSFLVKDDLAIKHKYIKTFQNIDSIITEATVKFRETARLKGVDIIIDESIKTLPHLKIDREMILNVFVNLIDNAVKYSYQNNIIRVTDEQRGDWIVVYVINYGLGILPEDKDRIFNLYAQGRLNEQFVPGTGTGLWVSRKIMRDHSGEINAWSELFNHPELTVSNPEIRSRTWKTVFSVEWHIQKNKDN